jgi:hypothetical protein
MSKSKVNKVQWTIQTTITSEPLTISKWRASLVDRNWIVLQCRLKNRTTLAMTSALIHIHLPSDTFDHHLAEDSVHHLAFHAGWIPLLQSTISDAEEIIGLTTDGPVTRHFGIRWSATASWISIRSRDQYEMDRLLRWESSPIWINALGTFGTKPTSFQLAIYKSLLASASIMIPPPPPPPQSASSSSSSPSHAPTRSAPRAHVSSQLSNTPQTTEESSTSSSARTIASSSSSSASSTTNGVLVHDRTTTSTTKPVQGSNRKLRRQALQPPPFTSIEDPESEVVVDNNPIMILSWLREAPDPLCEELTIELDDQPVLTRTQWIERIQSLLKRTDVPARLTWNDQPWESSSTVSDVAGPDTSIVITCEFTEPLNNSPPSVVEALINGS